MCEDLRHLGNSKTQNLTKTSKNKYNTPKNISVIGEKIQNELWLKK